MKSAGRPCDALDPNINNAWCRIHWPQLALHAFKQGVRWQMQRQATWESTVYRLFAAGAVDDCVAAIGPAPQLPRPNTTVLSTELTGCPHSEKGEGLLLTGLFGGPAGCV
jgi:hypothetical protein